MLIKVPQSPEEWITDIVCAYRDAAAAIPFGPAVDVEVTEQELLHLAPLVFLKRRGVKRTHKNQKIVTNAALSTFIANEDMHGTGQLNSIMAFSLCYIACHYALSLLDENQSDNVLNLVKEHLHEIQGQI